jgi:hypothetical protein
MTMSRTPEELERLASETEAELDALDPATTTAEDPADLRAIAQALEAVSAAEAVLAQAVRTARRNGRSWTRIGMALGVSRQAARQRWANPDEAQKAAQVHAR